MTGGIGITGAGFGKLLFGIFKICPSRTLLLVILLTFLISSTEMENRLDMAYNVSFFPTLYSVISSGFRITCSSFFEVTLDLLSAIKALPLGMRTVSPTRRFFLLLASMISLTATPYMRLS